MKSSSNASSAGILAGNASNKFISTPLELQSIILSFLNYAEQRSAALSCARLFNIANQRTCLRNVYKNEFDSYPVFNEDLQDQIKMETLLSGFEEAKTSTEPEVIKKRDEIAVLFDKHKDKKWIIYYKGLILLPAYEALGLTPPPKKEEPTFPTFQHLFHALEAGDHQTAYHFPWSLSAYETFRFPYLYLSKKEESAIQYFCQALQAGDYKAAYQLCSLSFAKSISKFEPCCLMVSDELPPLLPLLRPILIMALKDNLYLDALIALAYMHVLGLGVPQDFVQAEKYAEKALLENSDDTAVIGVAEYYWRPIFSVPHPNLVPFLERMFETRPTKTIAKTLSRIMRFSNDYTQARKWLIHSYTLGSADAACQLGDFYQGGYYANLNLTKAITWYERAFKRGKAAAAVNIVRCLEAESPGHMDKQRMMLCIDWLKKGAKAECVFALDELNFGPYNQMLNEFDRTWWILLHFISRNFRYLGHTVTEGINKELLHLVPVVLTNLGLLDNLALSYCRSYFRELIDSAIEKNFSAFELQRSFDPKLIEKFIQAGEKEDLLVFKDFDISEVLEKLKAEQCVVSRSLRAP